MVITITSPLAQVKLSAWESEKDLKAFAHSGAHLEAMKQSKSPAREIRIYTFPGERIPGWKEAKQLVLEKGKIHSFRDDQPG